MRLRKRILRGLFGQALAAAGLLAWLPGAVPDVIAQTTPAPAQPNPSQVTPAPADPALVTRRAPDAAFGAYQRGRYVTAMREAVLRVQANPQDAPAMTLIALLTQRGAGVPQDLPNAAAWYRRAHDRGDVNATFALAMMLLRGEGIPRDETRGREMLTEAANKNHALAAYNLALVILGAAQPDEARAAALLKVASDREIVAAQYALAVLTRDGRGVEKNPVAATALFARAASNGDVPAQVEYAIARFNGDGVIKDEAAAATLFRRAAHAGNAIAQNRLARMYAAGRGVSKDRVEAASWHLLAAGQGLADAWLDDELKELSADERPRAEKLAAERRR